MSKYPNNNVNNFFISKDKISKDGDVNYAVMMYLSDEARYNDYKILSISIVDATDNPNSDGAPNYMITVVTEDVELLPEKE